MGAAATADLCNRWHVGMAALPLVRRWGKKVINIGLTSIYIKQQKKCNINRDRSLMLSVQDGVSTIRSQLRQQICVIVGMSGWRLCRSFSAVAKGLSILVLLLYT